MKQKLLELMNDPLLSYEKLIDKVEKERYSEKWASGIMDAYSIEPYHAELNDCVPGKMLKGTSEKKKDRQCYFLDKSGNIISKIRYAKYIKIKNQWIVYRSFFINYPDHIIEYVYSSTFENTFDASLSFINILAKENNKPVSFYTLSDNHEYTESHYTYKNEIIISIHQKLWVNTYIERNYKVDCVGKNIKIIETL